MKPVVIFGAAVALALAARATTKAQPLSEMRVVVDNVRSSEGMVRVEICTPQTFLKDDCPYSASAPAKRGVTEVIFENVPRGAYAIQAYHDENDNHRVDRGAFGIPFEDIGFSGAPPLGLRGPLFTRASFDYLGSAQIVEIKLVHFR